jgi:hypothetical protein
MKTTVINLDALAMNTEPVESIQWGFGGTAPT